MTYEEFRQYVRSKCMYETIYDDSDGREILVIRFLDAFGMVNRAPRAWVGLTDEERQHIWRNLENGGGPGDFSDAIEAKLKEKNA